MGMEPATGSRDCARHCGVAHLRARAGIHIFLLSAAPAQLSSAELAVWTPLRVRKEKQAIPKHNSSDLF